MPPAGAPPLPPEVGRLDVHPVDGEWRDVNPVFEAVRAGRAQEAAEVRPRLIATENEHVGRPGAADELGVLRIRAAKGEQVAPGQEAELPDLVAAVGRAREDLPAQRGQGKRAKSHLAVRVAHRDRAHAGTIATSASRPRQNPASSRPPPPGGETIGTGKPSFEDSGQATNASWPSASSPRTYSSNRKLHCLSGVP